MARLQFGGTNPHKLNDVADPNAINDRDFVPELGEGGTNEVETQSDPQTPRELGCVADSLLAGVMPIQLPQHTRAEEVLSLAPRVARVQVPCP